MPESTILQSELDQRGVNTLWMNRVERRNALNPELIAQLNAALDRAEQDLNVRVVVIASRGAVFCGGADLDWLRSVSQSESGIEEIASLARLLSRLQLFPKPVIARVQGDAFGGGLGLICACDIVVATENARYVLPELQLGLIPALILRHLLRALGARAVRRWCLSGAAMSGAHALRIGLVHELVPHAELDTEIERQSLAVLRSAPQAVQKFKYLVRRIDSIVDEEDSSVAELMSHLRTSAETCEGIAAFFENRRPSWRS